MKSFFYSVWFCQREIWRLNKLVYILNHFDTLINSFTPLMAGLASKNLFDALSHQGTFSWNSLNIFFIFTGIIVFINIYDYVVTRFIEDYINREYQQKLRLDMIEKIHELDIQTFEDTKFLDTLENAKAYTNEYVKFIFQNSGSLIRFLIQSVIAFIALASLNLIIPLIIVAIYCVSIYHSNKVSAVAKNLNRQFTPDKRLLRQYENLFYNTASIIEMKLYSLYGHFFDRVKSIEKNMTDAYRKNLIKNIPIYTGLETIKQFVTQFATTIYVFVEAVNKRISIGDFSFYLSQISTFGSSVSRFGGLYGSIYRNTLEMDYYYNLLNTFSVLDYSKSKKKINSENITIEFKDITFSYPGHEDHKVFDNFNFKINPGEKVAIVGVNGAGKTTLIKLLLRFYEPQNGLILINGIDIKELDLNDWYSKLSALFQNFMKYEVSVKDNVAYGNISKLKNIKLIKEALVKSSAMDFVDEYPLKLDQILGKKYSDSIEPSGGQWQKVALARAFFRDAPILILDEPTSAIDAKAEAEIFEKVQNLSKDKTVIIISHRFSTVRNADRIVVIDQGQITEQGSHEELMSENGKYAELFELQAKGYK